MNVPYYLTIERGLVHFGSEVRKISYRHTEAPCLVTSTEDHSVSEHEKKMMGLVKGFWQSE